MDRVLNPKDEKQAIYEIYRACRLCGAGAGYKMPIIQSIIGLETEGIELSQKIKECIQIEVQHTDRMPPLICELCVDKVNDFYEFLTLCHQTNKRTRMRLGLPLRTKARDTPDSENCIIGVTEPQNVDSAGDTRAAHRSKKSRVKKESPDAPVKLENGRPTHSRSTSPGDRRRPSPAVKRTTRQNDSVGSTTQAQIEESFSLAERTKLKRQREKEVKVITPAPPPPKKVKLPEPKPKDRPGPKSSKRFAKEPEPTPPPVTAPPVKSKPPKKDAKAHRKDIKPPPSTPPSTTKPRPPEPPKKPAAKVTAPKPAPPKPAPPKPVETPRPKCNICDQRFKSIQALGSHNNNRHLATFTGAKYACNPCELWFPTIDECAAHHKQHRVDGLPYKCLRCYGYFKLMQEYEEHFAEQRCLASYEVPDVQCWRCWQHYPTHRLLQQHRCAGEDGRPGGKCSKCNRSYALLKNQLKHEASCTYKKRGEATIAPDVQARLLPMRVRIARCDALRSVPAESPKFGLDSKAHYPYLRTHVKKEPSTKPTMAADHMVAIDDTVKAEYWDTDSNDSQKVGSLTAMTLKTINNTDTDVKVNNDLAKRIFNIIDNLGNESQTSCESDSTLDKDGKCASDNVGTQSDISKVQCKVGEGDNDTETSCGSESVLDNERSDVKNQSDVAEGNEAMGSANVISDNVNANVNDVKSDETNTNSDNIDPSTDKMDVDTEKLDVSPGKSKESSVPECNSEQMDVDGEHSDRTTSEKSGEVLETLESVKRSDENEQNSIEMKISSFNDHGPKNDHLDSTNQTIEDCIVNCNNDEQESFNISDNSLVNDTNDKVTDKIKAVEHTTPENNENFSKIDEITNQILRDTKTSQENTTDEPNSEEKHHKGDPNSASLSIKSFHGAVVETRDKFNVNDLSDDDKKLMAALDAQIGEIGNNDQKIISNDDALARTKDDLKHIRNDLVRDNDLIGNNEHNAEGFKGNGSQPNKEINENGNPSDQSGGNNQRRDNDQKSKDYLIDNLLKKQDDLKSLDLDSVSDEDFNFDA